MKYVVEFDYQGKEPENMIAMSIKTGFNTHNEAAIWAHEHTRDGKVIGIPSTAEQIWEMLYK